MSAAFEESNESLYVGLHFNGDVTSELVSLRHVAKSRRSGWYVQLGCLWRVLGRRRGVRDVCFDDLQIFVLEIERKEAEL